MGRPPTPSIGKSPTYIPSSLSKSVHAATYLGNRPIELAAADGRITIYFHALQITRDVGAITKVISEQNYVANYVL